VLSGNEIMHAGDDRWDTRDDWWEYRDDEDDELLAIFERADRNNDNVISRREWYSDQAGFTALDRDRNGVLTLSEFLGENDDQPVGTTGRVDRSSPAFQRGYDRGLLDGRQAGREDRERNQGWDLEGQRELEQADAGYDASIGPREAYQAGYRRGFRAGYRQGFGPR
jgi:hypothetical protein